MGLPPPSFATVNRTFLRGTNRTLSRGADSFDDPPLTSLTKERTFTPDRSCIAKGMSDEVSYRPQHFRADSDSPPHFLRTARPDFLEEPAYNAGGITRFRERS